MTPAAEPVIIVISDATGETAEAAGKAALAQFGHHEEGAVRTISNVRSVEALEQAILDAKRIGALLVYTLVGLELRDAVKRLARRHEVRAIDLIGGLIRGLAEHLEMTPLSVPGLSHELDDEYFRRVAAVEFAVHNDDGKNPQNLGKADIVIVGISRASKTPLSNYIAHRGLKVANVPIVLGVPLPAQLEHVDPRRVFALTIDPVVLMKIRQARMESLGMSSDSDYGDLRQIRHEINHAKRVFAAHPTWTLVDMSRKAVEEAASTILETYRQRFPAPEDEAPAARGRKPAADKAAARRAAGPKAPAKSEKSAKKAAAKGGAATRRPTTRPGGGKR